jgi:hypothetical protein
MLIIGKPYENPVDNKFMLFIEIMISFYIYGLMGLTDFQNDESNRDNLGLYLVSIYSATIAANILLFLYETRISIKNWLYAKIKQLELK